MSDIIPPCDCEDYQMVSRWVDEARKELPAVCPSRKRAEAPAVANVGHDLRARLEESVRMLDGTSNIINLAHERAIRRRRSGGGGRAA